MLTIGLSTYIARIRRKRDTKNYLELSNFDGSTDFLHFLLTTLRAKQNQFIDLGDNRRRLQVNNDITQDGRAIDGTVDVGEFGLSSMLRNESGEHSFERKKDHSEMIPFYYRAWIPKNQDFGAFALQNLGHYGCKTAVEHLIGDEFRERFPEYVFELNEVVSSATIENYLKNGLVKEFSFLQHGVPKDWADAYGGIALDEREALIEINIKAKPKKALPLPPRLASYFTKKQAVGTSGLFEMKKFECEKFKVKLDVDGVPRTLSHTEFFNMTSRIDVSENVELLASGHPTPESLRLLAVPLLKKLAEDVKPK